MADLYAWLVVVTALLALVIPRRAVIVALVAVAAPFAFGVGVLVTARLAIPA